MQYLLAQRAVARFAERLRMFGVAVPDSVFDPDRTEAANAKRREAGLDAGDLPGDRDIQCAPGDAGRGLAANGPLPAGAEFAVAIESFSSSAWKASVCLMTSS